MATIANTSGGKRKREDNVQTFARKVRKNSDDEDASETPETESAGDAVKASNKHTKKERKTNRSSRIHSLKKLLTRDTLPSNIRQDKERELAALEYDQAKHKSKKQDKKVLEKYHYVRFIERQKAEKRLKQLRKLLQHEEAEKRADIEKDIHEMEVNRNYAIYAPLHQKYVSVFVKDNGKGSVETSKDTEKPKTWHEIEKAMQDGQSALQALRDGKRPSTIAEADPELKYESKSEFSKQSKTQTRSEGRHANIESVKPLETGTSDDDMSDGGFFQR